MKSKKRNPQLDAEWQALLARHSAPLERGAKAKGVKSRNLNSGKTPVVNSLPTRDAPNIQNIPSVNTNGGNTAKRAVPQYTGTSMIGVSIVHKSCLQPVFSEDVAKDLAKMRR